MQAEQKPTATAKRLGLSIADIDAEFGVWVVDPKCSLYSLRSRANPLIEAFAEK
jgi:hypothetical protein